MSDSAYFKRTIVKHDISSSILPTGSRSLRVYLPPGFNEIVSYPVVYCQDGEDFFNFGRIATIANKLILDGEIEPIIIAGVDVDKKVRTEEYSPDGALFETYTQSFMEEIVPFIEATYPVRTDWNDIVLAGDSLGGTVSLHIALKQPEKFKQVISLSGAFYSASYGILAAQPDFSWLRIFMIVGLQETAYETDRGVFDFLQINRDTHQLLSERDAHVHYEEHDGQHLWGFWQKHIPDALKYYFEV
ncbi:alpha/beta hydrolase-fold protein [Paenibacillus sp. SC116]|uniref:alpha/beta hydrolase n=1 Tax=Paenibacillus sp. SC116 TaxID=2968986 RepID=UPI00215A9F85|nr:alpha/beta hydrolase-fold protein [Paenibacillus sp. SC116]MCR8842790.1 alpha/beta hydrolase-fold protein [Paenibacillus sp. SC116]